MAILPDARELASYTLEAQHPLTRTWVVDARRTQRLAESHELDVLLAVDMDIASRRAERFAPHLQPEALLNRWVEVSDDLYAMLSIRFEGEDVRKPFVDSTPLSRPVTRADLPALRQAVREVFGQFAPGYVRMWSAEPSGHFEDCIPDKRFMAGEISLLRRRESSIPSVLNLKAASSAANYERACRAYHAIRAVHPEHVTQASLQSIDDLRECAEAGLLFDVQVDGQWAGYVGVMRNHQDALGLPAYVVQELVLADEYRGRGYGSHLTTLLACALSDGETVLIGTIHANNRGAMQAALSAGRVDVGGWFQVAL